MKDNNRDRLLSWRSVVADAAAAVFDRTDGLLDGDIHVAMTFGFARPTSHMKKTGGLRKGKPTSPNSRGRNDLDKLIRAVLDALTDVVWTDDGRVVAISAQKVYATAAGLRCTVRHDDVRLKSADVPISEIPF